MPVGPACASAGFDVADSATVRAPGAIVSGPISPPPITARAVNALPPYVSNGVIGIRYPGLPHLPGTTMVNSFAGRNSYYAIGGG